MKGFEILQECDLTRNRGLQVMQKDSPFPTLLKMSTRDQVRKKCMFFKTAIFIYFKLDYVTVRLMYLKFACPLKSHILMHKMQLRNQPIY